MIIRLLPSILILAMVIFCCEDDIIKQHKISYKVRTSLEENESITVYHTENRFDFIFAEDVAIGLVHLAEINEEGIVNLGTDTSHSIHDVISILKNYFPNIMK